MALLSGVMRFWTGLALSVLGLAGAVAGMYWDAINGRALESGGIGIMQTLMIAGGAAICVLGAVLMALPRRGRAPDRPTGAPARPLENEPKRRLSKKHKRGRRRQRNIIKK